MVDGILDGYHGEVLVDDPENPSVAALTIQKVNLSIIGGDPTTKSSREYIEKLPARSMLLFADKVEEWDVLCREFHGIKAIEA